MIALLSAVPRAVLWAALVAACAFSGWQACRLAGVQGDLIEAQQARAELQSAVETAKTQAADRAATMQRKVTEAQNASKKREAALRADADAARSESDGLRDDIAGLRDQLAAASRDAAVERASSLGAVLIQCAARYQVLAGRCDRHVSDLRTLMDAWPAHPPPSSPAK